MPIIKYTPLGNDAKSTLYKKGLTGPIVNHVQDYVYPSRQAWKTVFTNTLETFTRPRDVVLLYQCGLIPDNVEYEWADRLPGLIDTETDLITYWNDSRVNSVD